jgi:hypothetical protein
MFIFMQAVIPGVQSLFNTVSSTIAMLTNEEPAIFKPPTEESLTSFTPTKFSPLKTVFEDKDPVESEKNEPTQLPKQAIVWKYTLDSLNIIFARIDLEAESENQSSSLLYCLEDYYDDLSASIINSLFFATIEHPDLDLVTKINVAVSGMKLMNTLLSIKIFRESLFKRFNLLEIIMGLIWGIHEKLTRMSIQTIEKMFKNHYPKEIVVNEPGILMKILKIISTERDEDIWPFFNELCITIGDHTVLPEPLEYVMLSNGIGSEVELFKNSLEVILINRL